MTSWLVTASSSSMRSTSKAAVARMCAASSAVMPACPSSACASHARTSISFQISNLFSSSQMRAISGRE